MVPPHPSASSQGWVAPQSALGKHGAMIGNSGDCLSRFCGEPGPCLQHTSLHSDS